MKFNLQRHSGRYDYTETYRGKKKKYEVFIHEAFKSESGKEKEHYWYYYIACPNGSAFNCLWDNIKFNTRDECMKAAENKVDEFIKGEIK